MSIRSRLVALTAAAGVTVITGCGGSTGTAGSSPSSTATSSTRTHSAKPSPSTTATSSSPTGSNTTAAGAPGVPEPARQHTRAGAIAFANYYIDKVNALGLKPEKGVLEPLSLHSCKTCHNMIETVNENVSDKEHFDGKQAIRIRSYSPYVDARAPRVWVVMESPEVHVVNKSGRRVQTFKRLPNAAMVFHLKWTPNGWRSSEIKADPSVKK